MAVYVGIDVHKRFCQAALMDESGTVLHELRFENTLEGAGDLASLAKSINSDVKAVVEPSANYWIKLYDKLEDEGVEVKLSNPSRTKAIAEARIKMDRMDARTLAYLLKGNLVAESYVPTKKNRERRSFIRHRVHPHSPVQARPTPQLHRPIQQGRLRMATQTTPSTHRQSDPNI